MLPAESEDAAAWVAAIAESVGAVGTAGALVIALLILLRDHGNAERTQVDRVGAWAEPKYTRALPGEPRVEKAEIYIFLRNGSELRVTVRQLKYTVRTMWLVPTDDGAWERVAGARAGPFYLQDFQVRPGETWDNKSTSYVANLAHTAPERAVQLDLVQGVRCEIESVVVLDNAGREWEIRPSGGGRARRYRQVAPRSSGASRAKLLDQYQPPAPRTRALVRRVRLDEPQGDAVQNHRH